VNGTMTCVGLDVHARSTQATIDLVSGELRRARFGIGVEPVVGWLRELPGPVRPANEAGTDPTGFGLARAARAAGVELEVTLDVAPGAGPEPLKPPGRPAARFPDPHLTIRAI
jgi:hypothetical protein